MMKSFRVLIAALLLSCQAFAEDKIKINLSLVFTENELLTQELIKVADKIRERTDQGVDIQVFSRRAIARLQGQS